MADATDCIGRLTEEEEELIKQFRRLSRSKREEVVELVTESVRGERGAVTAFRGTPAAQTQGCDTMI